MNKWRHLITAFVLFSIILLPYWIYVPLFFAAIIVLPVYWEGIILGFLIDVFYGAGVESFPNIISSFAFVGFILLIIVVPLKERIRIHV